MSKITFLVLVALTVIASKLSAQWTSAPPDLYTTDNVGIGTTTPTYLLDVNGGDINLSNANNFFRINGNEVLYYKQGTQNLAIGAAHNMGSLTNAEKNLMVG